MLILGYAGHQRHGWKSEGKLASRMRHSRRYPLIFDAITAFGEDAEDLPLNFFPLDGVGHDSAAAILSDGHLKAAAAEERFNRFKHSTAAGGRILPPRKAVDYCLAETGHRIEDVDHIAFYCDFTPEVLDERIRAVEPHLSDQVKDRLIAGYRAVYDGTVSNERIADEIAELFGGRRNRTEIHFVPHHLAHAASAFYSSGYADAGVLTIDGFGERSSSIFAIGSRDGLKQVEETMLPGSLGVLYMMMTAYLGFKPLDGEYKVMGLASYGNPKTYATEFEDLLDIAADGSCRTTALLRDDFGDHIKSLFGPPRAYMDPVTQREMDIAAALQEQLEEAMFCRLAYLKDKYAIERICLSGGVALNVVMTGKVARSGMFKQTYVFPASGDDGASIGAAQYVQHQVLGLPPTGKAVPSMSLGPSYREASVVGALEANAHKVEFKRVDAIEETVADALVEGKVVGWFRGRMEFGPRALGNRSILADPRGAEMREVVNQRVKLREEFRPFAPAALVETADDYFDMRGVVRSDFMEFVVPARPLGCEKTKAVVHSDGSARIQTVDRNDNEPFWKVIDAFGRRTGVPVVLNTSFNVRGEPIVCTPQDAIRCFLSTDIDLLALENYVVSKKAGRVLAEDMAKPAIDD
ncbi:MAG TPA: carbamoyltransferase C-terminal domain-containing protein [Xanthobacteraceae bacterium]